MITIPIREHNNERVESKKRSDRNHKRKERHYYKPLIANDVIKVPHQEQNNERADRTPNKDI